MKMTVEHYNIIKASIAAIDRDKALAHRALELGNDKAKRFRWDMLYLTELREWICETLYQYLDDTHIDTALKAVMKELNY